MNKYKSLFIKISFLFLISFNTVYSMDSPPVKTTQHNIKLYKIEIIDSAFCFILDSIINYSQYCHKKNNNLITHYDIYPNLNPIKTSEIEFTVYSKIDDIEDVQNDSLTVNGVLVYKGSFFVFRDFFNIKGLEKYLKLSSKTETLIIKEQKRINFGKTYLTMNIIISKNNSFLTDNYCNCYYGKLTKKSGCLFIRKFFYDLFCPCRVIKIM